MTIQSIEKARWNGNPESSMREILRQAETYLDCSLRIAIAADQRATTLMDDRLGDPRGPGPRGRARREGIAAIVRGTQDGDQEEVERLEDYIDGTGPQSLAGAAVKLRRLADPNQLLCNADYDRDLAYVSARQLREFVERTLAAQRISDVAFIAAQAEVAEANRLADVRLIADKTTPCEVRPSFL